MNSRQTFSSRRSPVQTIAVCVAAALLCAGCMSTQPNPFDSQANVSARLAGADCIQLRQNMTDALAAREDTTTVTQAGDAARIAGTALTFVPMVGIAAPLMSGAGGFAAHHGTSGRLEPEALYRASHHAYHEMGCEPEILFGE